MTMNARRLLKLGLSFFLIVFVLPISLRAALLLSGYKTPAANSYDIERVDMSSSGLLPDPAQYPAARVVIMSAPMSGRRGQFLTHNWVILKRANAAAWSRYDVLGFASRDSDGMRNGAWLGNRPTLNRYVADGFWFGRRPVIIANAEGAAAAAVIDRIEVAIEGYEESAGHYRFWPGPNSNTFVQAILRAAPELRASLPPSAIGKDFRPGIYLGLTDSQTGIEAGIWGVFGFKIGWVEGLELNLLSFVAGLDVREPALKLPGFGRIEFLSRSTAASRASLLIRRKARIEHA